MLKIIKKLFKRTDPVEEQISATNQYIMECHKALIDAINKQNAEIRRSTEGFDQYLDDLMKSLGIEEAV